MRTISDIVRDAGGARAIHEASGGAFSVDAVYKWPTIGIPDRHWPLLMELADVTPVDLFLANSAARSSKDSAA